MPDDTEDLSPVGTATKTPKATTCEAMAELESGQGQRAASVAALMEALGADE